MAVRSLSRLGLFIVAGLLTFASAQAQSAPTPSQSQKQAVQADTLHFARIAAGFGCPKPAWADVNNGVLTMEYVPDNEDLRSWKNIVTVKITPIPDGVPRAAAANYYVEKILTVLRAARKIEQLVEERYSGDNARAAWFVYTMGEGEKREHSVGAIMLFGPGELRFPGQRWSVVMLQRQQRGERLDDAWITLSKRMFMGPFEKKA